MNCRHIGLSNAPSDGARSHPPPAKKATARESPDPADQSWLAAARPPLFSMLRNSLSAPKAPKPRLAPTPPQIHGCQDPPAAARGPTNPAPQNPPGAAKGGPNWD